MAKAAYLELENHLPAGSGGAGPAVGALVSAWATPGAGVSDFAVCNVGQLKAVGKPFWDRLITLGRASGYPWTANLGDDDDFAIANLGQLKTVFNFDVDDADADGLRDSWEFQYSFTLARLSAAQDTDQDGLTDAAEYRLGLDPVRRDTDRDGIIDGREIALGLNPLNPDQNGDGLPDRLALNRGLPVGNTDLDGDGVSNSDELARGSNPLAQDSDRDGVLDQADAFPNDPTRSAIGTGPAGDVTPPVITLLGPAGVTPL